MPRFEVDLTSAVASILQLPKGTYEFKIENPKTFKQSSNQPDGSTKESYGIAVTLRVTSEGEYKNKTQPHRMYLHTEGAWGMAKQFVQAAYGYDVNQPGEHKFNEAFKGADMTFDPDSEELGTVWKELDGKTIAADCDLVVNKIRPDEMQQRYRWRPV